MKSVKELNEEIHALRKMQGEMFAKHRKEDGTIDITSEQLDELQQRDRKLEGLQKDLEQAKQIDDSYQRQVAYMKEQRTPATNLPLKANGQKRQVSHKSLGQQFIEHPNFANSPKGLVRRTVELKDYKFLTPRQQKTLFERTAGFEPEVIRIPRIEVTGTQPLVIADLAPNETTTQSSINYMKETTFTNATDTVAEGATKPEVTLEYTEQTNPIQKIAGFIPVTEEQLMDASQVEALLNSRLSTMIGLTEQDQLLNGDGVAPNLLGYLNVPGLQTEAKGIAPDTNEDTIYRCWTKVVNSPGFSNPTALVINPTNWQTIRLRKTTEGAYIFGAPSVAGPMTLWGLPVVVTNAIAAGTALVGDFAAFSTIWRRMGLTIKTTDSHDSNFIRNIWVILAEERLALVVYRGEAFCTATALD